MIIGKDALILTLRRESANPHTLTPSLRRHRHGQPSQDARLVVGWERFQACTSGLGRLDLVMGQRNLDQTLPRGAWPGDSPSRPRLA